MGTVISASTAVSGTTGAELFTIGQLARRTGVPARTIRFWSDAGLVPPVSRSASGYRLYDAEAAARLDLVRSLRELGFGLDVVRAVLARTTTVADVAAAHPDPRGRDAGPAPGPAARAAGGFYRRPGGKVLAAAGDHQRLAGAGGGGAQLRMADRRAAREPEHVTTRSAAGLPGQQPAATTQAAGC